MSFIDNFNFFNRDAGEPQEISPSEPPRPGGLELPQAELPPVSPDVAGTNSQISDMKQGRMRDFVMEVGMGIGPGKRQLLLMGGMIVLSAILTGNLFGHESTVAMAAGHGGNSDLGGHLDMLNQGGSEHHLGVLDSGDNGVSGYVDTNPTQIPNNPSIVQNTVAPVVDKLIHVKGTPDVVNFDGHSLHNHDIGQLRDPSIGDLNRDHNPFPGIEPGQTDKKDIIDQVQSSGNGSLDNGTAHLKTDVVGNGGESPVTDSQNSSGSGNPYEETGNTIIDSIKKGLKHGQSFPGSGEGISPEATSNNLEGGVKDHFIQNPGQTSNNLEGGVKEHFFNQNSGHSQVKIPGSVTDDGSAVSENAKQGTAFSLGKEEEHAEALKNSVFPSKGKS